MGAGRPGGEANATALGPGLPIALCVVCTHDFQPRDVSRNHLQIAHFMVRAL